MGETQPPSEPLTKLLFEVIVAFGLAAPVATAQKTHLPTLAGAQTEDATATIHNCGRDFFVDLALEEEAAMKMPVDAQATYERRARARYRPAVSARQIVTQTWRWGLGLPLMEKVIDHGLVTSRTS